MKKHYNTGLTVLVLLAAFLTVGNVSGQEFYVKAGGGYTFSGTNSRIFSYNRAQFGFNGFLENEIIDENGTSTSEAVYGSYGKGGRVNLAFGTRFGMHIGAELSAEWLFGSRINSSVINNDLNQQFLFETHAEMFSLTPSIVISALPESRVNPYIQLGLCVGLYHNIRDEQNSTVDVFTIVQKTQVKNGISAGITTKLGAEVTLSETVSFFGEFVYNGISYKPDQLEFTELTVSGTDVLADEFPNPVFNLVDEVDGSTGNEAQVYNMPFSSVGLNAGIILNFGELAEAPRDRSGR